MGRNYQDERRIVAVGKSHLGRIDDEALLDLVTRQSNIFDAVFIEQPVYISPYHPLYHEKYV